MNCEPINNYDCDKIAVPLAIKDNKPKVPFGNFFFDQFLPFIFGLSLIITFVFSSIYIIHYFTDDGFVVTECENLENSITICVAYVEIISDPPTGINIFEFTKNKKRVKNFRLSPVSRDQIKNIKSGSVAKYKFYYKSMGLINPDILERIEEVK